MKKVIALFAGVMAMTVAQTVLAHEHVRMNSGMHHPCDIDMQMDNAQGQEQGDLLITREIDGFTVSFHIIKAPADEAQGGSHHVMLKFEKDGKVVTDLMANSKAVHPNGQSESKMLVKMGEWFVASYDLGHAGKHQVLVLFKTADGAKHFGGIIFPEGKRSN